MPTQNSEKELLVETGGRIRPLSRRNFLGYLGGASALLVTASACSKDDDDNDNRVNLGSGDVGILNYAYALEQLEAAFYTKVLESPYGSIPAAEAALLMDIRDHEIAHREFFKNALGSSAIPALTVNFTSIDFTNRESVLNTAKAFEDLGVSAYNGAGQLIADVNYLALAGKIVSVEARHAAWIRDILSNGTFADGNVVDAASGLEKSRTPNEVLAIAGTYITTPINASNLPTS